MATFFALLGVGAAVLAAYKAGCICASIAADLQAIEEIHYCILDEDFEAALTQE